MLWALVAGILSGFVGSVPVAGPVAVLVLRAGLAGQNHDGTQIARGSALAEGIYAGLAYAGIGLVMARYPVLSTVSEAVAALVFIAVGVALLRSRAPEDPVQGSIRPRGTGKFLLGFSLTVLNPTIVLSWSAVITTLYGSGVLRAGPSAALPFGLGVGLGVALWFHLMLLALARYQRRLSAHRLHQGVQAVGALLLVAGLVLAAVRAGAYLQSAG